MNGVLRLMVAPGVELASNLRSRRIGSGAAASGSSLRTSCFFAMRRSMVAARIGSREGPRRKGEETLAQTLS